MPGKRQKLKHRNGYLVPGYDFCGPFNPSDYSTPRSHVDALCKDHDNDYKSIQESGVDPYKTYNWADEDLINKIDALDPDKKRKTGRAAALLFRSKKRLAESGLIPKVLKKAKVTPETLQNLIQSTTMADGTGSGMQGGARETPVDDVYNVTRGPPNYTFASLPFNYDAAVRSYDVYTQSHTFRMTSPYDPLCTTADTDLNAGVGRQNVTAAVADSGDSTVRKANWYEYYSGLYKYYHTIGCKYTIFIENFGEPIWVYTMFGNDEVPNMTATNADMQLWPGVQYHYVNAPYQGVASTYGVDMSAALPTFEGYVPEENDENMAASSSNPNTGNTYETDNNIVTRSGTTTIQKFGEYRAGDFRRDIIRDADVENWTAVTTNPTLAERLYIFVKPQSNRIFANSAADAGDQIQYRLRVNLSYLTEFKELDYKLRYPVVEQPLTVTLNDTKSTN